MTPHRLQIRVYYEDTDFSGVVYHASYLRFMERARTEWLRALGVDQQALHDCATPLAFVVRAMTLDFLKPARMDDLLTVETRVTSVKGASLLLAQNVLRDTHALATADVRVAAVAGGRATRLPASLRARLRA